MGEAGGWAATSSRVAQAWTTSPVAADNGSRDGSTATGVSVFLPDEHAASSPPSLRALAPRATGLPTRRRACAARRSGDPRLWHGPAAARLVSTPVRLCPIECP